MQRRMVNKVDDLSLLRWLTCAQLSKEDEMAVGKDEQEVRREDQDRINKFSRLHQRELTLQDEVKAKAVSPPEI